MCNCSFRFPASNLYPAGAIGTISNQAWQGSTASEANVNDFDLLVDQGCRHCFDGFTDLNGKKQTIFNRANINKTSNAPLST